MRTFAALFVATFLLAAPPAGAQVFGQFTPAHPLAGGNDLFGAYLQLGDRADIGLLGQVRFSSGPRMNWGLLAGFADDPGSGAFLVGGDVRAALREADSEFPLDLAFDGAIGLTIADQVTFLELGPQIHYSHRFPFERSSGAITPYGSLFMDINHVSFDRGNLPPNADTSDTNIDLVARFGAEWEISRKFRWMGELEVGRGTNFSTGINVPF